jgi:prepilin-type N-terminal cleavage/methylation domain-containing protein
MRREAFTLIELLIVVIIVLLLMTAAVALFNEMFRGQEVRSAADMVLQAMSDARESAAKEQTMYFVRFYNDAALNRGVIQVYKDVDKNRALDTSVDKIPAGGEYQLPKFCFFADSSVGIASKLYPDWLGVYPTGYVIYCPGYTGVQQSTFDTNYNSPSPVLMGDVAIVVKGRPYQSGIDIDKAAGKVRRIEFLFKE